MDAYLPTTRFFWCLPWLMNFLYGQGYSKISSNFVGRNTHSWRHICDGKLTSNEIRSSAKSLAVASSSSLPADSFSNEVEYSVSTCGLLCVLLHMTLHIRKFTNLRMVDASPASSLLCRHIVDKICSGRSFAWCAGVAEVVVIEGVVDIGHLLDSQRSLGAHHRSLIGANFNEPNIHLCAFLEHLGMQSMNKNRSQDFRGRCQELQLKGIWHLGALFEMSGMSDHWLLADHVDLGILRTHTGRPRRVPGNFKRAIEDVATSTAGISSSSQLLASMGVMCKRRKLDDTETADVTSHKSGAKFAEHNMYQYYLAICKVMSRTAALSICLDGTRVSGEETLNICGWSATCKVGFWLPMQAMMRPTHSRIEGFQGATVSEQIG